MRLLRLSSCLLLLLVSAELHAQGNVATFVGGADAGPMVGTPAAIFWNPAALGLTKGLQLHIDVETFLGSGSYERAPDFFSPFYPEVDANVLFPVPFVGLVHDFGLERWRFGLATYIPFGSGGAWDDPNGPQRYHLIDGIEASLFVTGTLTYKVTHNFFVGAGVSYIFSALNGSVALDLSTTVQDLVPPGVPLFPESPLFEAVGEADLLTAHNYTANFGIFYQPHPTVDFGISFQLPVDIELEGIIDVTLPDVLALGAPALALIGFEGQTISVDGRITTHRPALINSGIAWRIGDRLTLQGVFVYALTSRRNDFVAEVFNTGLPYLDAPEGTSIRDRGTGNAFQIKTGVQWQLKRNFSTSGYLLYVHSAVPSSHVSASNPGFDLIIPTWMLQYRYAEKNLLGFSLSPIFAISRDVTNSIFDPTLPAGSGIGLPTANGLYKGFGLQFGLSFTRNF